jgi:hypothetical protein
LDDESCDAELYAMNTKAAFINFVASLFIFLFTYTAISKLASFASFRYNIGRSPFIGEYSTWIVVMLPALELAVAIFLFFPKTRLSGLYASFGLIGVFSLYVGYALLSGLKLPCSCGGIIQSMNWQQHFWVNVVLTLLVALAIQLKVKSSQEK